MINIPNDFTSARAYDGKGGFDTLAVGPHICKIMSAKVEKARSGKDMLIVAFDISEGSQYDGWYKEQFERRKGNNPDAKWPGIFRTCLTNNDGRTSGFFKGLITAVEESNSGYNFLATQGDERSLGGKLVAFNFGEEEYVGSDGKLHTTVRPAYAISIKTAREGIEPPQRKAARGSASQGFSEVAKEDLPDLPF